MAKQIVFYIRRVDLIDLLKDGNFIPNHQYVQVGEKFEELGRYGGVNGIPVRSLDKAPGRMCNHTGAIVCLGDEEYCGTCFHAGTKSLAKMYEEVNAQIVEFAKKNVREKKPERLIPVKIDKRVVNAASRTFGKKKRRVRG